MSKQKKSSKSKTAFKIVVGSLYLLIVLLYATFLVGNFQMNLYGEDAKFFGNYFYFINDSKSSAVIANPQTTVEVRDQIVFKDDDNEYYTGTINAIYTDNTADVMNLQTNKTQKVEAASIYGAATHSVPYLGSVMSFLLSHWGIIVIIVIPCFIFLIVQVVQLIRYSRRARNGLEEEDEKEEMYFSNPKAQHKYSQNTQNDNSPHWQHSNDYDQTSVSAANASNFRENYEMAEQKIKREKAAVGLMPEPEKTDYQQEYEKELLSRTRLEEFLKQSDPALEETLGDLHYKMKFQDTRELSKYHEAIIEENSDIPNLDKYGLQTSTIENGVEIKIDPKDSGSCILRLKNDGSLQIVTDAYVANIDAIV